MGDERRGFDGGEHRCAGGYRAVATAVAFMLACSLGDGAQLARITKRGARVNVARQGDGRSGDRAGARRHQ